MAIARHALSRMTGRDPHEEGRVATSLELFYDLVFVVAISIAGTQMGHQLAEGHYQAGIIGYLLCLFAAIWAWINFAWFSSAFDTDDWFYRVVTLLQMIGVAIIALGVPAIFSSLAENEHVDNRVVVLGYIVMRVGMIAQWLRAAAQSEQSRRACLIYAAMTAIAQVGWVSVLIVNMTVVPTLIAILACAFVELLGPIIAETRTPGTPWHAHHIAERYSLLTLVTLGEGVVGTVVVMGAGIETQGWTFETAALGVAGLVVTFAMWWFYFAVPVGEALHEHREKCFWWGYGHIIIFIAAAGVGAGLHVAGLYLEHEGHLSETVVVASIAIPLGVFCLGVLAMYDYLVGVDPASVGLALGIVAMLGVGVWLASAGVSVAIAAGVVTLVPVLIVVFDEVLGARRRQSSAPAII